MGELKDSLPFYTAFEGRIWDLFSLSYVFPLQNVFFRETATPLCHPWGKVSSPEAGGQFHNVQQVCRLLCWRPKASCGDQVWCGVMEAPVSSCLLSKTSHHRCFFNMFWILTFPETNALK